MEEGEERVRGGREMGEGRGGKRGEEGGMGCWSVPRCFCVLLSCKNQRIKKNGGLGKRLLPICIYTQLLV